MRWKVYVLVIVLLLLLPPVLVELVDLHRRVSLLDQVESLGEETHNVKPGIFKNNCL